MNSILSLMKGMWNAMKDRLILEAAVHDGGRADRAAEGQQAAAAWTVQRVQGGAHLYLRREVAHTKRSSCHDPTLCCWNKGLKDSRAQAASPDSQKCKVVRRQKSPDRASAMLVAAPSVNPGATL